MTGNKEPIVFEKDEHFAIEATCEEDAIAEFENNTKGKTTYYISVPIELIVRPRKMKADLKLSAPNDPDVVEDIRSKLGKGSRFLLFSKCLPKDENDEKYKVSTDQALVGKWLVEVNEIIQRPLEANKKNGNAEKSVVEAPKGDGSS